MDKTFKKSLVVASILSAITLSAQAVDLPHGKTELADQNSGNKPAAAYKVDENFNALNSAVTSNTNDIHKLMQDNYEQDNRLHTHEQNIGVNKNNIEKNKQAIAANTETIKQHYAEMKNNFAAVNSRIDNLDEEMKKGFASQAALTGLFQPYNVGKFNLSVALGGYESEQAMALGTGYRFNENFAMKAGIASDLGSFDSVTYNIGANFEW